MREGFLLDPDVAYFNHGELRRVPGRGLRRVPAAPARARARADGLLRPSLRRVRCSHARAALADVRRRARRRSRLHAERDVRAERGDPLAAHQAGGGDPHDEARVRRDPADARLHPRERRARRAGRADREHRDPHAGDRRLAHHVADGARAPGRGDLRGGAEARVSSRSSTARTSRATSRSTSRRSARTSTPATATSGCARRRARASCGHGPSTRSGSSRS